MSAAETIRAIAQSMIDHANRDHSRFMHPQDRAALLTHAAALTEAAARLEAPPPEEA